MSKRKLAFLLIVASGYVMALGMNCIPNIGGFVRGNLPFINLGS